MIKKILITATLGSALFAFANAADTGAYINVGGGIASVSNLKGHG